MILTPENAIRIISKNGKLYFHYCRGCGVEIGPNRASQLKVRSGYCNSCFKKQVHPEGQTFLTRIKNQAKKRNVDCSITLEEVLFLRSLKSCTYCGIELNWKYSGTNLDRKNPLEPYSFENVTVSCFPCNKVKSNILTFDEMRIAMAAIRAFRLSSKTNQNELEYILSSLISDLSPVSWDNI